MTRSPKPLDDKDVLAVLRTASLCSVAVQTPHGPHLTPQAFAVAAGRIWIVTSLKSVKVRSIRQSRSVGVLVRSGERSVSVTGEAEVLSPWSLQGSLRLLALAPAVAEASTRFAIGNLPAMFGYLLDLCRLPAGAIPLDRVLVAITPSGGLLSDGEDVVRTWGPVSREDGSPGRTWTASPHDVRAVAGRLPRDVAPLLDEPGPCAVAFSSDRGPIPLPAAWTTEHHRAELPWKIRRAAGVPDGADVCTMLDDSESLRPTQLRGVMLRGPGRFLRHKQDAAIDQRIRRATWWSGFSTGTVKMPVVEVVGGGRAAEVGL